MSFNETLNLKNVSKNSNEKELIRTEADYEKALAERDKLQAELDRLTKKETQEEHRLSTMQNRYKEQKRRSRNHRLIERGAILESLIPNAESYTNEPIKHIIMIAFGNLPGGLQGIHVPESLRDNS
ncbi:MAG: DUF3847 domain-containing protein [Oscillospiraceae bacterium]|nr:DUF3847 domain-containing protein [Oscillospiraceae bacterium]